MALKTHPKGYSAWQIGLHWTAAALVAFQLLGHEGIEAAYRAARNGAAAAASDMKLAWLHIGSGALIFIVALWRLRLRLTRGAPALPDSEPAPLRFAATATHAAFYLLMLGMPISGAAAWFLGVGAAAWAHGMAATLLLALIGLHLAGVLAQYFVFRSDVPARMTIADDS